MVRVLLAALVLCVVTGCGGEPQPHVTAAAPSGAEILRLAAAALVAAFVTYGVVRRRGAGTETAPSGRRALLGILVASVTLSAALLVGQVLGSDRYGPLDHALLASALGVAWSVWLLAGFLRALDERPSLVVARFGALFALLQVLSWLVGRWVDIPADWDERLTASFALCALVAVLWTHMAFLAVEPRHRWLHRVTLGSGTALAVLLISLLWSRWLGDDVSGRVALTLLVVWLAGMILFGACRRFDPPTDGPSAPPQYPSIPS